MKALLEVKEGLNEEKGGLVLICWSCTIESYVVPVTLFRSTQLMEMGWEE